MTPQPDTPQPDQTTSPVILFADDSIKLSELLQPVFMRWRLVTIVTLTAGVVGFGIASALPKWYTARTVMLPPQQQQSAAAAAVAQLGALASLGGNLAGMKSPADQYVALMQSLTISDQIIDQFRLVEAYDVKLRTDARKKLASSVRISAGKKDGLLTVEVDDRDPQRAADMANAYVDGLRNMTAMLAVTEAQQRRVFFEQQMREAKDRLVKAQFALGSSGLGEGLLKAEPKAAAEGYSRLRAEVTAAEVKLETLRRRLADGAPEVSQQESLLAALRTQLRRSEAQEARGADTEYITRYRNFKYEEALFEIFAKQYELARVDESREGALIQVIDRASAPERKAGPRRLLITLAAMAFAFCGVSALLIGRKLLRADQLPR